MKLIHEDKHRRCQEAISLFVIIATVLALSEEYLKSHGLWGVGAASGMLVNMAWIWAE